MHKNDFGDTPLQSTVRPTRPLLRALAGGPEGYVREVRNFPSTSKVDVFASAARLRHSRTFLDDVAQINQASIFQALEHFDMESVASREAFT